jgi:hypothetical protein
MHRTNSLAHGLLTQRQDMTSGPALGHQFADEGQQSTIDVTTLLGEREGRQQEVRLCLTAVYSHSLKPSRKWHLATNNAVSFSQLLRVHMDWGPSSRLFMEGHLKNSPWFTKTTIV